MDKNNISLIIEINFENNSKKRDFNELITYEELKKLSIELFNIDEKEKENFEYTYIDEDGDLNILGFEDNDIINASKELMDGNYLLQLNLSIIELKTVNIDFNKKEKITEVKIEDKNVENEIKIKKEDIEKVKKDLKNKLGKLYKNKIEEIQNKINEIINEKNSFIENEVEKFYYDDKIKDSIKININDIDDNTDIQNFKTDNGTFTILKNEESLIIYKNKNSGNRKIIEKSLKEIKEKLKSLKKIKNRTALDYMKYGEKIYEIMNKGYFDINDINEYFKEYLDQKDKEDEREEFINLLDKIYKYIEIRKINEINLEFFKREMIKESMINITKNNDFKSQLDSLINTTKFQEEILKNLNNLIKNE